MKEWFIFVGGLVALALVALGVTLNTDRQPAVAQPIAFNHQKHAPLLACTACHQTVTASSHAGLPAKELCWSCHQSKVTTNPEPDKIKTYIDKGQEIPWVRLFAVNDDIVYEHGPHIKAGFQCQTCHGNMGASPAGGVAGFGKKGAGGLWGRNLMEWCIQCHQDNKASTDCYTCHK